MSKYTKNLPQDKHDLVIGILKLFSSHKINALPMKLYSQDDDMDIVIIDKQQYQNTSNILQANKWQIKNNRSKLRERDKDFFRHQNIPYVIHLHQAFSWNTVPYLDSLTLWERKRVIDNLPLPSVEDELLIIAAHSLFENQYIKKEELLYGRKLLEHVHDISYMKSHAEKYHWKKGLEIIIKKLKDNNSSLSVKELLTAKINKLQQDFMFTSIRQYVTQVFNYFCIDWLWNYRLILQKKLANRPIIITVSGIDGGGKTTGARYLYERLQKEGKQVKIIHTGTTPFVNKNASTRQFRWQIAGYGSFIKDFMQIFFQFLSHTSYDVIIFDRYIFDTLVKIAYKQQKPTFSNRLLWLAFKLLPKPAVSFLFEVPYEISYKRDKNHSIEYHKKKYYLYRKLSGHIANIIRIETSQDKKKINSILAVKIMYTPLLYP